jgi:hypothetical protein
MPFEANAFGPGWELDAFLVRVFVGEPVLVGGDWLVPLCAPPSATDAILLDEGLAQGLVSVEEVSDLGEVNRVRVRHLGDAPLLLLDGEQIRGAKQNRTINASFVIAPGTVADLPVSCVEQGRWRRTSHQFTTHGSTIHATGRSRKLRRVAKAISEGSGYDANQPMVWAEVREYLTQSGVCSGTFALEDAMAARGPDAEAVLARMAPIANQVGLAAIRDDGVATLDLFGSATLFARAFAKIARGILIESIARPRPDGDASTLARRARDIARHALAALRDAKPTRTSLPGLGETLQGELGPLAFGAAVADGILYHAVATEQ